MKLYYGSRETFTDTIDHIEATDRLEIAQALSLVGEKRAIGDFDAEAFELVFIDEEPDDGVCFVYELEGDFESLGSHRFASQGPARIVKVTMLRPHDITSWRLATQEERIIIDAAENPDTI